MPAVAVNWKRSHHTCGTLYGDCMKNKSRRWSTAKPSAVKPEAHENLVLGREPQGEQKMPRQDKAVTTTAEGVVHSIRGTLSNVWGGNLKNRFCPRLLALQALLESCPFWFFFHKWVTWGNFSNAPNTAKCSDLQIQPSVVAFTDLSLQTSPACRVQPCVALLVAKAA